MTDSFPRPIIESMERQVLLTRKKSEQGGGLKGCPRHASCFLASLGAGVAPRAAVSHLGKAVYCQFQGLPSSTEHIPIPTMYIPSAFQIEDASKIAAFIQQHSFATLITHDGSAPFARHLPMLFHPDVGSHGTLVSHMGRANPQWQHFATGGEVLAIFHGPHSYISPSWYQTDLAVPTWNYATVHAYGVPTVINEHERVVSLLSETVSAYEPSFGPPWAGDIPDDFRDKLMHGIVAFEIPVTRIEGKFKLGQNRSAADTQGVFDALSRSDDADNLAIARMMVTECNVTKNA